MKATLPHSTDISSGLVSVVLLAHNEANHIPKLLNQLGRTLTGQGRPFQIIVVDDGSSDHTGRAAVEAAGRYPVKVVAHPTNLGMGEALQSGLLEAMSASSVIVTMDLDESHDPVLIPRMLERVNDGYDLVIASRFDRGGADLGPGMRRALIRRATNTLLSWLPPLNGVRDHSSGFRVYRTDLLKRIVEHHGRAAFIRETDETCRLELLLKAKSEGARIHEVPLLIRHDRAGAQPKKAIWPTMRRYAAVVGSHRSRVRGLGRVDARALLLERRAAPRDPERGHRALSVAVALVGIFLTTPLAMLVAMLVKLTSRGPVIYAQTRVGIDRRRNGASAFARRRMEDIGGQPFQIYKFRTMCHAPESAEEQVWASPDDPRVTPIGRVLRKLRLDELPQLFNVLRGDMNIVGPRPEQPKIFEELRTQIDRYSERQRVLPGITGLAQVSSSYDQSVDDVRRKVAFDLDYVKRRSVLEDVKIMLHTIPVILLQRGAW